MTEAQKQNPFDGPQLRDEHYKAADMSGSNFDGVNLADARFFAVLTNAKFIDTNLSGADFDDINLSNARFNNVNMAGSTITNANLSGLSINGATLANTDIQDVNLTGTRINGVLVTDLIEAYEKANS